MLISPVKFPMHAALIGHKRAAAQQGELHTELSDRPVHHLDQQVDPLLRVKAGNHPSHRCEGVRLQPHRRLQR